MHPRLYALLNIKPAEYKVVSQLFLVQFFLGIATAFLFTSTLTIFLHAFEVQAIPKVYLLSALLLLVANFFYARLEHALTSRKLLQVIIIFSAVSLIITWAGITFFSYTWLPFVLSGWNIVVYTLLAYAFWGMAAIIFNVRESKRIFSVVGSGDIPAKLMGYALVPLLIPFIGVTNLLWLSVLAFAVAYFFLLRFQHKAIDRAVENHVHQQTGEEENAEKEEGSFVKQYFHNRLIFCIALFSLIAFTIYALIDYTLLVEIKSRFSSSPDLAIFIGVFFAIGRILAIFFKLLFSSRVISRLGLANSLLISPVVLLLLTGILLLPGEAEMMIFYTFGVMVLLTEVLKSAVQEPAFFVLFQPLEPHVRLKGHLIAKGYMLPFALLGSGLFLLLCDQLLGGISILFIAQVLAGLLLAWIASIYLVKKAYLLTLIKAIRKGWFTGTELFLNDAAVRELLLQKTESDKPTDVILGLELLEKSGYRKLEEILRKQLQSPYTDVRKFALNRLIRTGAADVLPMVRQQLQEQPDEEFRPTLLKAYYYLIPVVTHADKEALYRLENESFKAAVTGLLLRDNAAAHQVAMEALESLVYNSSDLEDKHLALDILSASPYRVGQELLGTLLEASSETLCKQAIVTVGKVRVFALVEQVVRTATERKAHYALQKSLVLFGDEVFKAAELKSETLPDVTVRAIVRAAGKVKGEASTDYLLELLTDGRADTDDIIEALWLKQAALGRADKKLIGSWLTRKLVDCQHKVAACRTVHTVPALQLLTEALSREVQQDLNRLLKGFALCYERARIDRVMKLLQLGNRERVANAIEILEHLIPKRYFKPAEKVIDFTLEGPASLLAAKKKQDIATVVASIIRDDHMHCTSWTRSVACYLVPELREPSLERALAAEDRLPKDQLFQETKDYVLSVLT